MSLLVVMGVVGRWLVLVGMNIIGLAGCILRLHGGINWLKIGEVILVEVLSSTSRCYHGRLRNEGGVTLALVPALGSGWLIRTGRGGP